MFEVFLFSVLIWFYNLNLTQQHRQEFVVRDVLNLSGHDVSGLLVNAFVVPMRIKRRQFPRDFVVLADHNQMYRRQVHVFI